MTHRAYTLAEIDALREAVWRQAQTGMKDPGLSADQIFISPDTAKYLESKVRTYMAAGITAQDFKK